MFWYDIAENNITKAIKTKIKSIIHAKNLSVHLAKVNSAGSLTLTPPPSSDDLESYY